MEESRLGSNIDGKYVSQGCSNCKFWTEHKREGTCSQKIKTEEGLFLCQIVPYDYVCSTHEDDDVKTHFNLYIKKDNTVAINGTYSKNALLRMKEYIDNLIKDY